MRAWARFLTGYSHLFAAADDIQAKDINPTAQTYAERWNWYITLDALSNSHFTQWPYFLNLNIIEFLNYVSFIKGKTEHEKRLFNQPTTHP